MEKLLVVFTMSGHYNEILFTNLLYLKYERIFHIRINNFIIYPFFI